VRTVGCAIIGQTGELAHADQRPLCRARRHLLGSSRSPLITASILSKKLAAGLDGLGYGRKARLGRPSCARMTMPRALSDSLVETARGAGLPIVRPC